MSRSDPSIQSVRKSYGSMEAQETGSVSTAEKVGIDVDASSTLDKSASPQVSLDQEMDAIGFGRFHYGAIAILGLANASDAVELLCLSFILPSLPSSEVTDTAKASLSSAIFVGMLVGGLVFGVAGDIFGRRSVLALSLAINSLFGFLSSVSTNFGILVFCRVMGGFGVGGSIPGVFGLAAELLPAKRRGFALSVVASFWMVGSLYAAGAAWIMIGKFNLPWQSYAAVCGIPAGVCAILVRLYLPESPRFSLAKGDLHKAVQALVWIARINRTDTRLNKGYVLEPSHGHSSTEGAGQGVHGQAGDSTEGKGDADAESTALLKGGAVGKGAASPSASGAATARRRCCGRSTSSGTGKRSNLCNALGLGAMTEMFSPSLVRTSSLLVTVWFALSFGWYGLNGWLPTLFSESDVVLDPYQDAFLAQAATLPGNILSIFLMDRVGRKRVLAATLLASCAATAGLPFAKSEVAAVAAACVMNAVSTMTWNALDCLSTESFPTHLRTSAMGILAATGRIGSISGQFVFGSLIHISTGALLGSAAGMLGLGAVAGLLLPGEMAGKALED